jgi:hypothetical protein
MGLRVDKYRMLNIRLEQLEVEGSKHGHSAQTPEERRRKKKKTF